MDNSYHIFFRFSGFWDNENGIAGFSVAPEMENIGFMTRNDRVKFILDFIDKLEEVMELDDDEI